jgi:hypothetical protein
VLHQDMMAPTALIKSISNTYVTQDLKGPKKRLMRTMANNMSIERIYKKLVQRVLLQAIL